VVLVPGLLALVFGWFAFRSRIKGVYFSIMTQALTFAGMLLFFRNETGFGGNNGFTDFRTILGFDITAPAPGGAVPADGAAAAGQPVPVLAADPQQVRPRAHRRARCRNRLMFCGYDPRGFKLLVWVLSAVLCGLAGALYVPQVGIINPSEMSPANSIEAAVWVAVGGRGTLIGPARRRFGQWHEELVHRGLPEYWLFSVRCSSSSRCTCPRAWSAAEEKEPAMRGVPPVHPEFMLEPVFDQLAPAATPSAWASPQGRPRHPPRHGADLEDISVSFDGFKALNR
jgi:urea transport system permease protein